jgi:hypothetical protein
MRTLAALFLVIASLATSQAAFAASQQAKERAAKKACLVGDTAKGVEILAELYLNTNDIAYLFNQGRCLEQNRRYEDAIGRFREYLVKGGDQLTTKDTALARKHIETCESYLSQNNSRAPVAPAPVAPAPVAPPVVVTQPESPAAAPAMIMVVQRPQPSNGRAGSGLRIAGISVAAVGLAASISAVILNVKAYKMAKDLEKPDNFNRDTDNTRKQYKTLAWIGYGAGAACLVGGTVLYLLGQHAGRDSNRPVTLVASFGPNLAGASLQGAF